LHKLSSGLLAGTATIFAGALGTALLGPIALSPAQAAPDQGSDQRVTHRPDNRPGPLTQREQERKAKALALLNNGAAKMKPQRGGGATVNLGDGTEVEFAVAKTDKIFTVLSEFGTEGSGRLGREPGPLHNEIPEPDRDVDNSTTWTADYNNGSGESMKSYYEALSGGAYSVDVTTTNWVQVPGNASTYGDNAVEDFGGSWAFIDDSVDAWYQSRVAAGDTTEEIDAYLAQFDEWDRYDFDEDGDFNEPDGYLDHFQAVHAGEGEDAGADPDAIWSHRWYVNGDQYGVSGPSVGEENNLSGGAQIGDSKYFVGDYTVEPENGGLGVFAHEFGHDLGLPDFYDTNGGENGTAFWTLMSSGSWLGHGEAANEGIGTTPGLMGPEEKLFLGWLDYSEVNAGESGTFTLSPSQNTVDGQDQAIKVNLPDSSRTDDYVVPPAGENVWWSGRGDNLKHTLTRDVPAGGTVTVSADLWYDIEDGYDYLYAEYSADGGDHWTQLGKPITGAGTKWASKKWSYKSGGVDTIFRFRYATDGGVNEPGAFLDDITVKSSAGTDVDGAETPVEESAWTSIGWVHSTGTETVASERYYLLENRQYVGYDATLAEGPYQFSEAFTRPNWVEFFKFQDGMLVWLVDQGYTDNNVSEAGRLGIGYALPVDSFPNSLTYPDGTSPSNRREPFDATFGLDTVDETCLHKQVATDKKGGWTTAEACAGGVPQQSTFVDSEPEAYYDAAAPQNSVKVLGTGLTAEVVDELDTGSIVVDVDYPPAG
jgi:immune inhibitor A